METWPGGVGAPCPRFKTEEDILHYLDYVRFAVRHFKDRIKYYEIWNGYIAKTPGMNNHSIRSMYLIFKGLPVCAGNRNKISGPAVCRAGDFLYTIKWLSVSVGRKLLGTKQLDFLRLSSRRRRSRDLGCRRLLGRFGSRCLIRFCVHRLAGF